MPTTSQNIKKAARKGSTKKVINGRKGHILAIAIDKYTMCPPLYNCVRDTDGLIKILTENYRFEETLVTKLYNEGASQENIIKAIRKCATQLGQNDDLLILYSGHGIYDDVLDEGYWIPVDAKLGNNGDYLSNAEIIKFIKAIKTHHTALIVDSCFSGTLAQYKSIGVQRLEKRPSRWLLTSGRQEVVSDGKPGTHSPFIEWILKYLRLHKNDRVLFSELVQYVKIAVGNNAEQIPIGSPLQGVGDEGGEFILHSVKDTTTTNAAIAYEDKEYYAPIPETDQDATIPTTDKPDSRLAWIKNKWIWAISLIIAISGFFIIKNMLSANPNEGTSGTIIQKVLDKGMYGFKKGNSIVIPTIYEDAFDFTEGLAAVKQEGKYGYIDTAGNKIIDFKYEDARQFSSGLAPVKKGGFYGFINTTGIEVIDFIYLEAQPFSENIACAKRDSLYIFIDSTGAPQFNTAYSQASSFINGRAHVEINGEAFTIDRMGNRID